MKSEKIEHVEGAGPAPRRPAKKRKSATVKVEESGHGENNEAGDEALAREMQRQEDLAVAGLAAL